MSPQKQHLIHGRDHMPNGSDPIPGLTISRTFGETVQLIAATNTLLGYWRLGEGASPFLDTSGHPSGPNNLVKTTTGTAMIDSVTGALSADQDDGAVQFNATGGASGDYLSAADAVFDGSSSVRSVVLWVKPTGFYAGAQYVFGTYDTANGGWHVGVTGTTGDVFFQRRDVAGNVTATGSSLPLNEWSFVSVDWTPGAGVNIYVNAVLVHSDTVSQGIAGMATLTVGRATGTPFSFQGAVDEITIWGTRLTAAEVGELYAAGLGGGGGAPGPPGPTGATGATGATGPAGLGVPAGGTIYQVPAKTSSMDYATAWANQTIEVEYT